MSASKGGAAQGEPPPVLKPSLGISRSRESPPRIGIEALAFLYVGELPLRSTRRQGPAGAARAPGQIVAAQASPARETAIIGMLIGVTGRTIQSVVVSSDQQFSPRVEAVEAPTF
jgi:hypothetical protein